MKHYRLQATKQIQFGGKTFEPGSIIVTTKYPARALQQRGEARLLGEVGASEAAQVQPTAPLTAPRRAAPPSRKGRFEESSKSGAAV